MKVGDKIPVTIANQQVTLATVKELGDGTVTLEFPATRAVMAVRTEIDAAPVAPQGTEHAILGVENQPSSDVTEAPSAAEVAPVVESATPETPVVPADGATSQSDAVTPPAEGTTPAQPVAPAAPVESAPAESAPVSE